MRRLWKRIQISGFTVPVYLTNLDDCEGEWSPAKHEIRIRADLPPARRHEVMLHETIHAVSDIFGLGLREAQIRPLSIALHALGAQVRKPKP